MKKLKVLGVALAMAVIPALAACGGDGGGASGDFESGTTMAKLNKAQKITVGTKFDQPLFGLAGPTGDPEGFDVEIAKIITDALGIPEENIDWKETVSQNREPFIQNGQVDIVVATYTINDTRKEVIDFAGPYYVAGQAFLVAEGNPENIGSPEDLGDNTVCTVTGSTSEKNIREYTDNVITVDKYSDCLEPIRTGQAQALTTDNVILAGLVAQNEGEFEVVGDLFTLEPYGIGMALGDDDFREFINDTLQQAYDDGSWAEAWESTAGTVLPLPDMPEINRY